MTLNPIQLEVLWNRLLSVANEQQTTLIRTAFSTIVRESLDLACGVFDTKGHMIAQSLTGTPGHINPMATGAIHLLNAYPPETLEPGDVLITNDPWQTAGQVNDFTVMTPVFRGNTIVGYFSNCCHAPDIGGRILSAEAREVFEEGLQVPITKLFRRGEPNEELFKIIRANVRTPDETVGDLYAQTASNAVGAGMGSEPCPMVVTNTSCGVTGLKNRCGSKWQSPSRMKISISTLTVHRSRVSGASTWC